MAKLLNMPLSSASVGVWPSCVNTEPGWSSRTQCDIHRTSFVNIAKCRLWHLEKQFMDLRMDMRYLFKRVRLCDELTRGAICISFRGKAMQWVVENLFDSAIRQHQSSGSSLV